MDGPCPIRRNEYESFIRTERMSGGFARHFEACQRCQSAFENDARFDRVVELGAATLAYPQPAPCGLMRDDE